MGGGGGRIDGNMLVTLNGNMPVKWQNAGHRHVQGAQMATCRSVRLDVQWQHAGPCAGQSEWTLNGNIPVHRHAGA